MHVVSQEAKYRNRLSKPYIRVAEFPISTATAAPSSDSIAKCDIQAIEVAFAQNYFSFPQSLLWSTRSSSLQDATGLSPESEN